MITRREHQLTKIDKHHPIPAGALVCARLALSVGGEWSYDEDRKIYTSRQIDALGQKWEFMLMRYTWEEDNHVEIGWQVLARYYMTERSYTSWSGRDLTPARRTPREAIELAKLQTIETRDASLRWLDVLKRQRYTGSPITPEAKRKARRAKPQRTRGNARELEAATQLEMFRA